MKHMLTYIAYTFTNGSRRRAVFGWKILPKDSVLKKELIYCTRYRTRAQAQQEIFEYIDLRMSVAPQARYTGEAEVKLNITALRP